MIASVKALSGRDFLDVADLSAGELRQVLDLAHAIKAGRWSQRPLQGRHLAMLFQNAVSALNPFLTVSSQLSHLQRLHHAAVHEGVSNWAPKLLAEVGIPDVAATLEKYPHHLSGGMAHTQKCDKERG